MKRTAELLADVDLQQHGRACRVRISTGREQQEAIHHSKLTCSAFAGTMWTVSTRLTRRSLSKQSSLWALGHAFQASLLLGCSTTKKGACSFKMPCKVALSGEEVPDPLFIAGFHKPDKQVMRNRNNM
jgi:hypothetical protein